MYTISIHDMLARALASVTRKNISTPSLQMCAKPLRADTLNAFCGGALEDDAS
jgi:hypothetical protein